MRVVFVIVSSYRPRELYHRFGCRFLVVFFPHNGQGFFPFKLGKTFVRTNHSSVSSHSAWNFYIHPKSAVLTMDSLIGP